MDFLPGMAGGVFAAATELDELETSNCTGPPPTIAVDDGEKVAMSIEADTVCGNAIDDVVDVVDLPGIGGGTLSGNDGGVAAAVVVELSLPAEPSSRGRNRWSKRPAPLLN